MKKSILLLCLAAVIASPALADPQPLTLQSYLARSEKLYKAALAVQQAQDDAKATLYGLGEDTDPLAAEFAVDVQTFLKAKELQRKAAEILYPCEGEK